ncbi:5-methyltetrahydropteroyltriglutamate--homocysteine S-methyltransferase, partial [Alkalihalophilus lindianensis]|nr:5-methyltetrahydropteroyltriglutamate--homocysteine S-methyltransferase [Alkalihalophilus lindianensis]
LVDTIIDCVPKDRLWLQPSSSLLHVPVTIRHEDQLNPIVKEALAFADEKLAEVQCLVESISHGQVEHFAESTTALERLNQSQERNRRE